MFEISLLVRSEDFVKKLRIVEETYKQNSMVLDLDVWLKRPKYHKFLDNVARLTSSLQ